MVERLHRETDVAKDGTFIDHWSWRIRVQKREAREDVGTRSIRFYKSFEEVQILRAGTRTEGEFKPIQLKDLQERAVTDENPGFSSLYEFILSFPNVQEGSILEFDYDVKTTRALEPDFWGQSFVLEAGAYENFEWLIHSAKPLSHYLQDPSGKIRFKSSKKDTELSYATKGFVSLAMADESEPFLSNERKVLMMAGFLSDWKGYGVHSALEFEKRAAANLSSADQKIVKKLKLLLDAPQKIQGVLQHITNRVRYFGDWRTSEQMYVPRTLDEISRTLYGDCKDFALLAVKMLREVGLSAKPVWILSSEEAPAKESYRFPTDNAFNHVIVLVGDGKNEWWVDPTNPASRVGFLADEIAGRPGLVLDGPHSELRSIRPILAQDYHSVSRAELIGGTPEKATLRVTTSYDGMSPISAGEQLKTDGATAYFDEHLQRLMPPASMSHLKIEDLKLQPETRELNGYKVTADFENFWVRTSAGPGFSPVREDVIERLRNLKVSERAGDFILGKVYSYEEDVVMTGYRRLGNLKLDCTIRSPWIDFSQTVEDQPGGVVFHAAFQLKEPEMILRESDKPRVLQLQRELRDCAGRVVILLEPLKKPNP